MRRPFSLPAAALCLAAALAILWAPCFAGDSAAGLRARHDELRERLQHNAFARPLALDSTENGGKLRGDVHAVLDHPFPRVRGALAESANWCEILTLPFNVQKCEAQGDVLRVAIGRKPDSPADATQLELRFAVTARSDDLLQVELSAPTGPAGTRDYRIAFAATPLDSRRTFVHMGYGYTPGTMSRLAMQAYLSTSGADKVGFSSAGAEGLVGGMRGVLERNTMRYFLAIDSYLATLDAPRRSRLEHWYASTEKYPRQLREMTKQEYLKVKKG